MPLPLYQRRILGTAPVPGYRQQLRSDPTSFGQTVAEAATGVGQDVVRLVEREGKRADAAALMDAYSRMGHARLGREKELQEHRGRDAIEWGTKASELFSGDLDAIEESLTPRQREKFLEMRIKASLGFEGTVNRHTLSEGEALARDGYAGATTMATQLGAEAAMQGSVDGVRAAHQDAHEAWQTYMEHQGLTGTQEAEKARLDVMTRFHAAVLLEQIAKGDHRSARDYLGEWGDEISADVAGKVRKQIKAVGVKERAHEIVDGLVQKYGKGRFELDLLSAAEDLNKRAELLDDPEKRDAAEARLEEVARDRRGARQEWDGDRLARIEVDLASKTISKAKSHPLYDELSVHGQALALRLEASARRARRHPDSAASRDRQIRWSYKALPATERMSVDTNTFGAEGSPALRAELSALQRKEREGFGQRPASFGRTVNAAARRAGLKGKKKDALIGFMFDLYDQYAEDNPNAPYPPQQVIDRWEVDAFEEVTQEGLLWDTDVPRYLAEPRVETAGTISAPPAAGAQPQAAPPPPPQPTAPPPISDLSQIPTESFIILRDEFRQKFGRDPAGADLPLLLRVYNANPGRF